METIHAVGMLLRLQPSNSALSLPLICDLLDQQAIIRDRRRRRHGVE